MSLALLAAVLLLPLPLAAPLAITDVDGNPLKQNTAYYMVPVSPTSSGGVTLAGADPSSPGSCPFKVALTDGANDRGIPVKLAPESSETKTLDVGGRFTLSFALPYRCTSDTPWTRETASDSTMYLTPSLAGHYYDIFTIDSAKTGYALKYCDNGVCYRIGAKKKNSEVTLTYEGLTFNFVFQKDSVTRGGLLTAE